MMRPHFRKPTSAVMWLLIINVVAFFLDLISRNWPGNTSFFFGLSIDGLRSLYIWQPVTYMFMHANEWHLLFNMIGLYVFGTEFERHFGKSKFLEFYFTCGLVGGFAYLVLGVINPYYAQIPIVGASGAIYGLLVAAIIFFPHIQVILVIFPVPIRVFGLIILAILLMQLIGPGGVQNLGGEICHIGGAITGLLVFYAWGVLPGGRGRAGGPGMVGGYLQQRATRRREGAWARKQKELAELQAEVDRILAKVHNDGINSLTNREKKILSEATRRQKERDSNIGRIDKL